MSKAIGALNKRLVFQVPAEQSDGQGGSETVWVNVIPDGDFAVWGSLQPLSSGQVSFSAGLQARTTHRVEIRTGSVPGLSIAMRIRMQESTGVRVFQVKGFRDLDERKRRTEITVEEGAQS